jgi:membrane protease YdiL (CAAX protease family)
MKPITSFVNRHPLVTFFGLAYALSWLPSLFEAHGILPLGPLVAALIIMPFIGGWSEVKGFLGRIVQWRVGLRWYALVLGLPPILLLTAGALNVALGAPMPQAAQIPAWSNFLPGFVLILLLIGVGEEPAWRGVALPRLQVGRSALAASLILGLLHALWHLPLFGLEYDRFNGLPWLLSLLAYTIVTTALYRHTNGNLLLPALFHTSINTWAKFLFNPLFTGASLLHLWWLWAALWWLMAIIVVLAEGREFVWRDTRTRLPEAVTNEAEPTVAIS